MFKGGTYLSFGDSITKYNYATGDNSLIYPKLIAGMIEKNYGPIQFYNAAQGGANTNTAVNDSWYNSRYSADLCTINLGMNDSAGESPVWLSTTTFKNNIKQIVHRLQSKNPKIVIVLCCASNTTDTNRLPYIQNYRDAMTQEAAALGLQVCDFSTAWTTGQNSTYLNSDGVHPNVAGHQALANVLWTTLTTAGSSSLNWLNSL